MAKRIVSCTSLAMTATADTANLVDNTYPFLIQNATSTQTSKIIEIYLGGQAASTSTPMYMLFSRDSTVATGTNSYTASITMDAAMDAATTALASVVLTGNNNATTKPQRSATLHLMNLSFNAYGGVVRWAALDPTEVVTVVGNAASLGECSFSAYTGSTASGLIGAHMVYETL